MPERMEKLKATIEELEAELESLPSVDDQTRAMLEEAIADIQTALHKRDPDHLEPESLNERLTLAAERFETTHPTLFGIVSRTIDALAQIGI